jgi:Cupin-like domain
MIDTRQRHSLTDRHPFVVFENDPAAFAANFRLAAFSTRHHLANHPLFSLERLAAVAEQLMKSRRGFRFVNRDAQGQLDARFSDIPDRRRVSTAFNELERSNAWIKLSNVGDVDEEYTALMQAAVQEMEILSGQPIRDQVSLAQLTVFISSPHSVTPYHFDHEVNFLCQIQGEKDVCVFPAFDRELVPHEAVERFYCGDLNSVQYSETDQSKGKMFRLAPGIAVHHPPLAPHWVRNDASVSVSVSINLCMDDIDRRAHVYQINYYLRKAGLQPTAPGKSAAMDVLKAGALNAIGTSRPKSADDVVNSGLNRLRAPVHAAKRVANRLRGSAHIKSGAA